MNHTPLTSASADTPTDLELITRIAQDRSPQALDQLYGRYRSFLGSVVYRVINNSSEIDDVLQDVFVQVWERAASYSAEKGQVVAWLVTLARRRSLDHVRRKTTYQHVTERYEATVTKVAHSHSDFSLVDSEVAQNELTEQVRVQLAKLPEAQRQAVHLAFFAGMSQREIAAKYAIPLGTIKTRLDLGLRKLGRSLRVELAA